ncbi:MAG: patatin-like phospholipase family protein, partial [Rhodoferax sp.]
MNSTLHTPADRPSTAESPIINLALQGGGSHGAFTWGVLDALLEDGRITLEGISGTSAGAMNAVALAHGFAQVQQRGKGDAREAAREALSSFWNGVVNMGALSEAQRSPFDVLFDRRGGGNSPTAAWTEAMTNFWSNALSPYQSNPFDINPLRHFLEQQIDFEAVAQLQTLKVFVVATRVSTGKAEVFSGKRLTADAVMASACLPMAFKAV